MIPSLLCCFTDQVVTGLVHTRMEGLNEWVTLASMVLASSEIILVYIIIIILVGGKIKKNKTGHGNVLFKWCQFEILHIFLIKIHLFVQ